MRVLVFLYPHQDLSLLVFLIHSFIHLFIEQLGNFLVVQWLRLHASNAGGPGSIPGQGTKPDMPHLRVCMLQAEDLACGNEDGRFHMLQLRPGAAKYTNVNIKTQLVTECLCVLEPRE